MRRFFLALALFIIFSLCVSLASCDGTPHEDKESDTSEPVSESESETPKNTEPEYESVPETPHESDSVIEYPELVLPEAVDALSASIVKLYCYDYDKKEVKSHGSGFFIDEYGTFITNAHVVKDAYFIRARVHTGEFYDVDVIYSYSRNASDHAVCAISGYTSSPVKFDTSAELGEKVYALGYPGSTFRYYASEGEVVNTENTVGSITYIENTAVIYDGNSGGILANADGEVLGIATGSLRGGEFLAVSYAEFAEDLDVRNNPKTILERFHTIENIPLTEHNAGTFFKITTVAETTTNPPMVTLTLRENFVSGTTLIDLSGDEAVVSVALIDAEGEVVGELLEFTFSSRQNMIDGVTVELDSSALPKGSFSLRIVTATGSLIRID